METIHSEKRESTFEVARDKAKAYGLELTNTSEGCYQLRCPKEGWILNLYPRRKGFTPRAYHDPNHRGPFLDLPELWTLADVVKAAAVQWCGAPKAEPLPDGAGLLSEEDIEDVERWDGME
jgi:hypothetical protein